MNTKNKQIIISNEDYQTLNNYINVGFVKSFDTNNAALLKQELKRATVVKGNELPPGVVRLNSKVKIKEGHNGQLIELMLVLPEKANIKESKVSIFAPLGTALIGFSQGEKIKWNVPAGIKTFTILEVHN